MNFTEAEKSLLELPSLNQAQFKILAGKLREQSFVDALPEDALVAQAIYDQHKIEGAKLITADISLPSGKGIINCRLNDEHIQIRF